MQLLFMILIYIIIFNVGCAETSPIENMTNIDRQVNTDELRDMSISRDVGVWNDFGNPKDAMVDAMADMTIDEMVDATIDATIDAMVDATIDTMVDATYIDNDEDGYDISVDCDDQNALIYPGAIERCNMVDDDCDDVIDETEGDEILEGSTIWYEDLDQDTFGNQERTQVACQAPNGFVERGNDCDDDDALIHPNAQEVCDGIDNNCVDGIDDGVINDANACLDEGLPVRSNLIDTVQLTVRNGNNAGDDGSLVLEIYSDDQSKSTTLNNISWDDHMRNTIDVYTIDFRSEAMSVSGLAGRQVRIVYDDSDAWAFSCTQLSINGVLVSCHEYQPEITLDAGSDEVHILTLPNPLPTNSLPCTCYDTYLSHGPIIGKTTANSVRIWGRTDATRKVTLKMGTDLNDLSVVTYRYPQPEQDHTFEMDAFGLQANTTYHYSIEVEDQSTRGTFKTAPDDGVSGQYKFAVGSCAKTVPHRHPEQKIFAAIQQRNPDMMFMLGDNVYFDSLTNGDVPDIGAMRSYYRDAIQRRGSWAFPHYPPTNVYDPNDPTIRPDSSDRARWWGSFGRDDRANMMASIPTIAIWDDHDFYYNNADAFYDDSRGRKPWTFDTLSIFNQYWPNPDGGLSDNNPSEMGIFFKHTWGDVDIFALDTRFHRDDTRAKMLGSAQMNWLKNELSNSTATFKFILSGSIFAGDRDDDEKWPRYEDELNELYNHIWGQQIGGVVLMSGDVHVSAVLEHRNPANPNDPYIIYEIISSGLANYGPSGGLFSIPSDYGSIVQMRYLLPMVYDRRFTNAFASVSVDTTLDNPQLNVDFFDERGDTMCLDCPFEIMRNSLGPR